jgi:hypothetical protein
MQLHMLVVGKYICMSCGCKPLSSKRPSAFLASFDADMVCSQCTMMRSGTLANQRVPFRTTNLQSVRRLSVHPAPSRQHSRRSTDVKPVAALQLDWSDPDTLVGALGAVLGIGLGIGVSPQHHAAFMLERHMVAIRRALKALSFNCEVLMVAQVPAFYISRDVADEVCSASTARSCTSLPIVAP